MTERAKEGKRRGWVEKKGWIKENYDTGKD